MCLLHWPAVANGTRGDALYCVTSVLDMRRLTVHRSGVASASGDRWVVEEKVS